MVTKDAMVCRRLSLFLLPMIVTPSVIILMQVFLVIFLSHHGPDGRVLAAVVMDPFKKAVSSSLGLFVILGTTLPLGSFLMGCDRHGGSLEGILSTPVSTASIWLGRTIVTWIPGVIMYLLSVGLSIITSQLCMKDIGAYSVADLLGMSWMVPILFIVTLLVAAFMTLLLLGGTRIVILLFVVGQVIVTMAAVLWLSIGMMKGKFIDYGTIMRLEIAAIPILFGAICILRKCLLNRERIMGKFK